MKPKELRAALVLANSLLKIERDQSKFKNGITVAWAARIEKAAKTIKALCDAVRVSERDARRAEQCTEFLTATPDSKEMARYAVLSDEVLATTTSSTLIARELALRRQSERRLRHELRVAREEIGRLNRSADGYRRHFRQPDPLQRR